MITQEFMMTNEDSEGSVTLTPVVRTNIVLWIFLIWRCVELDSSGTFKTIQTHFNFIYKHKKYKYNFNSEIKQKNVSVNNLS